MKIEPHIDFSLYGMCICTGTSSFLYLPQDLASEKAELKRALKSAQDSIEELKVCIYMYMHLHCMFKYCIDDPSPMAKCASYFK